MFANFFLWSRTDIVEYVVLDLFLSLFYYAFIHLFRENKLRNQDELAS